MIVHEGVNGGGDGEAVEGERTMKVRRKGVPACQGIAKDTDAYADADPDTDADADVD